MNILIFLIILLVLVLVHEFGHFFTAKKFGVRVDEFGFGFPPKLFSRRYGETEYSFNLLPLGGFVKIFGENPEAEQARYGAGPDEDRNRSFQYKAKWKQAIVLLAGVFANFLLAWLLFSFGFVSGFPASVGSGIKGYALQDVNLVIISVVSNSPAELAGLKSGDRIVSLKSLPAQAGGNEDVSLINPDSFKSFITSRGSEEIEIGYARGKNDETSYAKLTPVASTADGELRIGIAMDQIGIAKLPFFAALWEGTKLTLSITKDTAVGLYALIVDGLQGKGSLVSITGPVGIVGIVGDAYQFGLVYLLSFSALISINLAIINLLPFPALDGGRLFFLLIEKIKGSRISPKVANTANMIGFAVLILLMVFVTYHDIVKLF